MEMEMVWIKLFDLRVCFFEGYMYFFFLGHLLKRRFDKKWASVAVVDILMLGVFGINQLGITSPNLVASLTLCMVLRQILFISPVGKKVFYVLLCCFIVLCGGFVMMVTFYPYLGNEITELSSDPKNPLMLVLSSKLLAFMAIRVTCHVSDNGKSMFFPSLAPHFCCFPITCPVVYVGVTYSNISFLDPKFPTIILEIGCVLSLAANIVLFVVYDRMIFMMNRMKEYGPTDIKGRLENQHYLQIEEINRKRSGIIHDTGSYLQTIETLALEENNERIVDIIGPLNRHIVKVGEEHYCSHQILNAVLNGKKQEALIKKIDYNVYVGLGFEKPEVEDIGLISVMSNLVDSATEAANKCPNGLIDVQMYKANDGKFATIKITNNHLEQPAEEDGGFITRRQNPTMHGIRICNVKKIVEHYGEWTNIEYGEGEFCVAIMFT